VATQTPIGDVVPAETALSDLREAIRGAMQIIAAPDVYANREQLRAVQKTLRELTRKEIPIPPELQHLEAELLGRTVVADEAEKNLGYIRSQLEEMLELVSRHAIGTRKTNKRRTKEGLPTTPIGEMQQLVVDCLSDHGGQASPAQIFACVEAKMNSQFLPGDLVKGKKGTAWRSAVRGLRSRMIRAGVLARDSGRGTWRLRSS
jgi:hypothetical protein